MSKKTKMIRVLVTVLVLGGAFATLLATSMRENAQYFKEVDEVMPVAADWYGKKLDLHGFVEAGSIMRRPNTLDIQFKVRQNDSTVLASYTGIVPDTFKDGAEVVLKGKLSTAGFQVDPNGVTAKCPSKYQPIDGPVK
jgi:cytochrome c-type biogenesis protein CcmE